MCFSKAAGASKQMSFCQLEETINKETELKIGAKFSSFKDLKNAIRYYEKQNNILLTCRSSYKLQTIHTKKLPKDEIDKIKKSLKYSSLKYTCGNLQGNRY